MTILAMSESLYDGLISHLLPPQSGREQAAFLFARPTPDDQNVFEVVASERLTSVDFAAQENDYLELDDEVRAKLIKQAHDLDASLVEMHSHPGPFPAAFSWADRRGLSETVPYMWWRLKKRPYFAIVVAQSGFDALVWRIDPKIAKPLEGIRTGSRLLHPTNNSLGG
ncbi:Mov34/MPN/PAD-1 family protein [uncultured Parasphingorhabdus sp.]|uniref:Mov34/MPN/PAD-1 family protein n=1 Tax=uncultured Parasphingorhabdus sp. TaxID=2709694 RepID=UPI0030DAD196|tara:strand:+ start:1086 stop:1589 length:504 start_codon:yes stop_codon:yes gene_type:complete